MFAETAWGGEKSKFATLHVQHQNVKHLQHTFLWKAMELKNVGALILRYV
jgi:hypothetical protein